MHKRWLMHKKKAGYTVRRNQGSYFHRAIIKYKSDLWEHEILEVVQTIKDAELAEIKWITHFKSNQREFGYNLTTGGNVGITFLNEEVRMRIAEKITKIMADPARKLLSSITAKEYQIKFGNPFKGKHHTKLTKDIISKKSKAYQEKYGNPFDGKQHSKETKARMKVAAQKRVADPNWQPPIVKSGITEEWRQKMSEAKKGKHPGKITKEMLLEICRECKTQKQMADKLECTPANISFLLKSFNIAEQVQLLIKQNKGKNEN